MQFLWKWVEDFVGKGLDWLVIAEIMFYASSNLVPLALPLGILLASLMTFGNLGEQYELTAIKAAGISLMKTMRPLIVLTALMSIGAFFFSNNVLPYTNLELAKRLYDVSRKRPELNLKTGIFNNDIEGYSIKIGSKNQETGMMHDFMIYNHLNRKGNPEVTLADSGLIRISPDEKEMEVTLFNGRAFYELKEKARGKDREFPHRHDEFEVQNLRLALTGFEMNESDASLFKNNYQMMNLEQLSYVTDSLKTRFEDRHRSSVMRLLRYSYAKYESKDYLRNYLKNGKDSTEEPEVVADKKPSEKSARTEKAKNVKVKKKKTKSLDLDSLKKSISKASLFAAAELAGNNIDKSISSIESSAKSLHDRAKWIKKHELAWYRKFSMSFACLIFFFIGAPLGAIIRKGGFGLPILVSIILFMVYYVLTMTGEKFAREGMIPVFSGAWLSSFILFPLGVFITYKAMKDSALLNTESIRKGIGRLTKVFKKKNNNHGER